MQVIPANLDDPSIRAAVAELITEYAESLAADGAVCTISLQNEINTLGQRGSLYSAQPAPGGRFLLALDDDGTVAGGVGISDLAPDGHRGAAELRRLYIRPAFRGCQLGRWLAMAAAHEAEQLGYHRLRLETVPSMQAAQALYESMGFVDVPAPDHAAAGIRVMELDLTGR